MIIKNNVIWTQYLKYPYYDFGSIGTLESIEHRDMDTIPEICIMHIMILEVWHIGINKNIKI